MMANIIGKGKPATRLYMLIPRVFFIRFRKSWELKKRSKCLIPTHGLLVIPSVMRKSLKAI